MASRIEARVNPALLVWARETAGFSAGVAADRLKLPVDRLEMPIWQVRQAVDEDCIMFEREGEQKSPLDCCTGGILRGAVLVGCRSPVP